MSYETKRLTDRIRFLKSEFDRKYLYRSKEWQDDIRAQILESEGQLAVLRLEESKPNARPKFLDLSDLAVDADGFFTA